jgi:ribosomal protein L11 methyltransferase
MILEAMENIPLENKDLCDFGCGSGILSIYAAQRGAHGFGIEIDVNAAEAARQNLFLNNAQGFNILTGDLSTPEKSTITFDVILANINRNVIEESIHVFYKKARPGAYLFCAGFLNEDAAQLSRHLEQAGFTTIEKRSREGWTMLLTRRKP